MTRNQAPKRVKLKAGRVYAGENGLVVLCLRMRRRTAYEEILGRRKRVFVCRVLSQPADWPPDSISEGTWREDGAFHWHDDEHFCPDCALTREIRK